MTDEVPKLEGIITGTHTIGDWGSAPKPDLKPIDQDVLTVEVTIWPVTPLTVTLPPGWQYVGLVFGESPPAGQRLQCKHIDDLPILELLRDLPTWGESTSYRLDAPHLLVKTQRSGTWFKGFDNSVGPAFPAGDETPPRLIRAKMASLIKRGFIDGCACGCRGDFALTQKGRAVVGTRKT